VGSEAARFLKIRKERIGDYMQRFRHPSNLRNDPKFRAIEKNLDEAGYARAVKLLEIVAEVGGKGEEFSPEFTLRGNTDATWLADEWRISTKKAQATLEVFAGVGLIDAQAWSEQIVRIPLLNDCLDEYTQRQQKARNSRATTDQLPSHSGVATVTVPTKTGRAQAGAPKKDDTHSVPTQPTVKVQIAWTPLGISPCGTVQFKEIWETTWNGRGESEHLSEVMARCVEHCRLAEVEVPEAFHDARQEAEHRWFEEEISPYLTKESA
jgi:hypothetical protein